MSRKISLLLLNLLLGFFVFVAVGVHSVSAQQCAPQRVINQFACLGDTREVCDLWTCSCHNNSTGDIRSCNDFRANDDGSGDCSDLPGYSKVVACTRFTEQGEISCRQTGSQTVNCDQSSCSGSVNNFRTCSGGGGSSGSCSENTSSLNYQCYVNGGGGSSPPPSGGGNACAWCTNPGQCASSGGTFSDSGGYCGVAGDGCCATGGGGGDGGGDGGNPSRPTCDDPKCGGRFCGQGDCGSTYHNKKPSTPAWNHANQSTIVIPAGQTLATLEWVDNNAVMACWKESESRYDLKLEGIDAFGGRVIANQFEGDVGRPSVEGTGNTNREGVVMRYRFTPLFRYYRATIRSVNNFCRPNKSEKNGDWTTIEFQVHFTQTGKVFLDVNDDAIVDANGRCVSPSQNEADAATHLLAQRNVAPWNTYEALQGWGYYAISGAQNDLTDPSRGLGTPTAGSGWGGTGASAVVDNNWNTPWISNARSRQHNGELDDDVRGEGVGYRFTVPQDIQYARFYGWSSPDRNVVNASDVPHLNVSAKDENGQGIPLYSGPASRSWFLPPGTLLSRIDFTAHVTGWTDSRRMGVAEIELFKNPVPAPKMTSSNGGEVIASGGWSNQGVYTLRSAAGTASDLELDLNSDELTCSCPEGCQYTVTGSNQNLHYFVNVKADPWFQVHDGGVAAYGDNSLGIVNPIPEQCTPDRNCTPALVLTPNSTAPVIMTGGGSVDVSDAPGQQTTGLDDENKNWLARLSATPNRQDFAYFRRIYKFPSAEIQDDFELNFNNASKPGSAPRNGGTAYYQSGDLTIASPWVVDSGESYVILVDGSLNVQAEITVAPGGFLAFVTSDDVVFDGSLGTSTITSTTPVVEGVFIANDKIRLPESQLKFVGAGTFVGWNGFEMFRNYESTDNWSAPTELFIYRSDLLQNAPEEMKTPRYEWNEVNP